MKLTLLSNLSSSQDSFGYQQKGVTIYGAGETIEVSEASYNDSKCFVWVDVPNYWQPVRVHKSILQPC